MFLKAGTLFLKGEHVDLKFRFFVTKSRHIFLIDSLLSKYFFFEFALFCSVTQLRFFEKMKSVIALRASGKSLIALFVCLPLMSCSIEKPSGCIFLRRTLILAFEKP